MKKVLLAGAARTPIGKFGGMLKDLSAADLGVMYTEGKGVTKDYAKAMKWYRKAADLGYTKSMNNIGFMYRSGQGVKQDDSEAFRWFHKAADLGQVNSMYNIAVMYEQGIGIDKNKAQALAWYRKAADKGHGGARKALEELEEK